MAHRYDYQVDFKDLEVAYTARDCLTGDDGTRTSGSSEVDKEKHREVRLSSVDDKITRSVPVKRPGTSRFGIQRLASRLSHPGSWKGIQESLTEAIEKGRFELATKYDGKRAKLKTADGNLIDTMCVDRRTMSLDGTQSGARGDFLMICCEGNSCFYEIGNMTIALTAGFSAFGWNTPGFCCSTGVPEPEQVRRAIDTVMQYALNVLQFDEANIVLFGYSIGGYPATWAATQYPKIRGLFLDACFDELLPLVQLHLQGKMNSLTEMVLKNQDTNLNIAELLKRYRGPVTIVRRDRDNIIGKNAGGSSGYVNHTNRLLKSLLVSRYPDIVNKDTFPILEEWLNLYDATQAHLLEHFHVKCPVCPAFLDDYLREHCREPEMDFPALIGKEWDLEMREHVTLYLANRHLKTFSGDHVSYLPSRLLQLPWDPSRVFSKRS
ncbi:Protein ABHD16A [Hypsibius exemplaris]|uniref:Protein ABHD16A n=1 Tax=Hypsibius exemplaris TaxID=2072580 RepID=A0A1W0WYS8_HYPEX|nr:Protein ABHD16A [Hypsibius exemplaris]